MRWTYNFFIVTHFLLITQSIAHPIVPAISHTGDVQFSRREPLPARTSNLKVHSPRRPRRHRSRSHQRSHSPPPHAGATTPPNQAGPSNLAIGSPGSAGSRGNRTPSNTGNSSPGLPTPQKKRRVRHPKGNVGAGELKSKDYRAVAIRKEPPGKDWKFKFDADHILEPQTVANYLNNHRGNVPVDGKCKAAIRLHLNTEQNLKMLDKDHNKHKEHIVYALNRGLAAQKFNPEVKQHIEDHKDAIFQTAMNIDKEFRPSGKCGKIQISKPGGIMRAAQRMIRHAEQS